VRPTLVVGPNDVLTNNMAWFLRRLFLRAPDALALGLLRAAGLLLRDVVLTREELLGLEQELLFTHEPPLGSESVPDWLMQNGNGLGRSYINAMRRHFGAGAQEPVVSLFGRR